MLTFYEVTRVGDEPVLTKLSVNDILIPTNPTALFFALRNGTCVCRCYGWASTSYHKRTRDKWLTLQPLSLIAELVTAWNGNYSLSQIRFVLYRLWPMTPEAASKRADKFSFALWLARRPTVWTLKNAIVWWH